MAPATSVAEQVADFTGRAVGSDVPDRPEVGWTTEDGRQRQFADFPHEQLAPLGRVTMRRMFGKTGVFCDGLMFAMVTDDTLYFRVDDGNRAAFNEAESWRVGAAVRRRR